MELEQIQGLYADSLKTIRKCFPMEHRILYPPCAVRFAAQDRAADAEGLTRARELVRERVGALSSLRGMMFLPLCVTAALGPDPEARLDSVVRIYKALRSEFSASSYLAATAMILADLTTPERALEWTAHAKELYRVFRRKHRLLTGIEDAPYAILMALPGRNEERMLEDMDACFENLRFFALGDRIQTVSELMALSDMPADRKCGRFLELYKTLRASGLRILKNYGLPVLAGLAVSDVPAETLAAEAQSADAFLKTLPQYRHMTYNSSLRHVHALMLVKSAHGDDPGSGLGAIGSALTLITMQYMAIMVSTTAATQAAINS